jgi:hypothetical protein
MIQLLAPAVATRGARQFFIALALACVPGIVLYHVEDTTVKKHLVFFEDSEYQVSILDHVSETTPDVIIHVMQYNRH